MLDTIPLPKALYVESLDAALIRAIAYFLRPDLGASPSRFASAVGRAGPEGAS